MTYSHVLEIASHWASILTAGVAVLAYGLYLFERYKKRRRLEEYLKAEKATGDDKGQRTILHLVARLGMTEAEIVDAAFRSNHIQRKVRPDMYGLAGVLLLEYSDEKSN